MATAGRNAISTLRSAKDAPAHTQLKVRTSGTGNQDPSSQRDQKIQESLKKLQQVEERHNKNKFMGRIHNHRTIDTAAEEESRLKMIMATAEVDDEPTNH